MFNKVDVNDTLTAKSFSGTSATFTGTISGSALAVTTATATTANIGDLDGNSGTFSGTVSGSNVVTHTVTSDKATIKDLDANSATFSGELSGSTVKAHLLDADKAQVRDLTITSMTGSGKAQLNQVNAHFVSSSNLSTLHLTTHVLNVAKIDGNDVVKAANLNRDIVYDIDNGHGGLNFANGVLSVGHHRQIFSRDATVANRAAAPTQSSGSGLFATASLVASAAGKPTIIMSGSEMVYLNGVLLIPAPAGQKPPVDGDYTIDYNKVNGPVTVELHETLAMDGDDILVVQYLSGTIS